MAARPAREAKPARDADGFELLEAAPCDLVRHEGERRVLGHVVQGEGLAVPFGGQALQLDRRGEAGKRRGGKRPADRSEEHTSELQSLMRISYAVFCLKKKTNKHQIIPDHTPTNSPTQQTIIHPYL